MVKSVRNSEISPKMVKIDKGPFRFIDVRRERKIILSKL